MKKRGSGGWWSLVVLAGAGLAAAGLFQQRRAAKRATAGRALPPARELADSSSPSPLGAAPSGVSGAGAKTEEAANQEAADLEAALALPDDVEISWQAGPGGPIRVCQRNPEASAAIVFVHGMAGTLEQWAPALASLGSHWRGIAFDLPGHGGSDAQVEIDMELLAATIGAVAEGLNLRRFVLVSHSQGTAASIRYAGHHKHRVAGLMLVDPNGDQTQLDMKDRRSLLRAVAENAHEELRGHFQQIVGDSSSVVGKKVMASLTATPEEVLVSYLSAGFGYSPLADLDRYDGPVRLVLSPLNDLPYSLHRLRPQLKVAVLHNVGHWLMLERPGAFAQLLDNFLDSVGGRVERVN